MDRLRGFALVRAADLRPVEPRVFYATREAAEAAAGRRPEATLVAPAVTTRPPEWEPVAS